MQRRARVLPYVHRGQHIGLPRLPGAGRDPVQTRGTEAAAGGTYAVQYHGLEAEDPAEQTGVRGAERTSAVGENAPATALPRSEGENEQGFSLFHFYLRAV